MQKLLTIKEVSDLLQVNQRTVLRMIQGNKIPAVKIGNQWRFHPVHLESWVLTESAGPDGVAINNGHESELEFQIFSPNRVLLDVECSNMEDVFRTMVDHLAQEGYLLQPAIYLQALLEREKNSTTGIGNGIALPHAWHSISDVFRKPLVECMRLRHPVNFQAVDGQPVDLVFLLCSPRNRTHLKLLSGVAKIVRDENLVDALRTTPDVDSFVQLLSQKSSVFLL